ncbi:MAG: hypothetical protein HC814_08170 [Rhodobacteraceae bacterium]|nr:hypothetical protein [Paracoccaceae bacterium]
MTASETSTAGTGSEATGGKFTNAARSAEYVAAQVGIDRNRATGQAKTFAIYLGQSESNAARLLGAVVYVGTEVFAEDYEATAIAR